MRALFGLIFFGCLAFLAWQAWHFEAVFSYRGLQDMARRSAAMVFQETSVPKDLAKKYQQGKLRVLIVPGHDNQYSGALYQGNREADFNIELARQLAEFLATDSRLDVLVSRDLVSGDYRPEITEFFKTNHDSISSFKVAKKALMAELIASGLVADKTTNNHAFAKEEIAHRLYGTNKWANENNIDLAIHIHFNDYPGHKPNSPGKYQGLTVYVPEEQLPNSRASLLIGKSIYNALNLIQPTSNNPLEVAGVVPDQELIAVGSNASVNAAAILIEYGYIYEPQFQSPQVREKFFEQLAQKTYEGLHAYLNTK